MDLSLEAWLKLYGPMGLLAGLLILVIWKALLPRIDKQQEENRAILAATLEDARNERNRERETARLEREESRKLIESQANKFLESLQITNKIQKEGFDEILREVRKPPRK
jgi:DNA-binding TFAR19-related protein (PDSD5 family)